jgi:outer membrane protein OmpA-like peptidoglycan-associated protein
MGASYLGVKIRLPFSPKSRVQIAGKFGAFMDTSQEELDGMNYFWTRKGTAIESSIYETFDLTSFLSMHFEQGYAISGSRYYDDQVVGGAGLQVNVRNRLALNLEINNRTFLGVSPQSVFQVESRPKRFSTTPGNVTGSPSFLNDSRADFDEDYLVFTPSLSLRLNKHISLDFGAHFNLADQAKPRERYQAIAGITFQADIRSMLDSDHDGIPNSKDAESRTPKGFPVDKNGAALDTDGDGVPDGRDRQQDTPRGARVDADGAGIDSDGDGVYDGLDLERQTPSGSPVDRFGVALDSDRDGVPNDRDREPNSLIGAVVDRDGVGLDDDGDGVPYGLDAEPHTPLGARVNPAGASLDGDGDGVPDGLDEEANTPKGVLVDRKGRALVKQESSLFDQGFIRLNSLRFEAASVLPDPSSYPLLDEIGRLLVKYPTLHIQVEGHTDDAGNKEANYELSRERAKNILTYLLKRFPELRRERFRVVGFGPDKPVVSNATPEGRKENRRVDFVVVNRSELLKINPEK